MFLKSYNFYDNIFPNINDPQMLRSNSISDTHKTGYVTPRAESSRQTMIIRSHQNLFILLGLFSQKLFHIRDHW